MAGATAVGVLIVRPAIHRGPRLDRRAGYRKLILAYATESGDLTNNDDFRFGLSQTDGHVSRWRKRAFRRRARKRIRFGVCGGCEPRNKCPIEKQDARCRLLTDDEPQQHCFRGRVVARTGRARPRGRVAVVHLPTSSTSNGDRGVGPGRTSSAFAPHRSDPCNLDRRIARRPRGMTALLQTERRSRLSRAGAPSAPSVQTSCQLRHPPHDPSSPVASPIGPPPWNAG